MLGFEALLGATHALRRWRKPAVGTDVSLDGNLSKGCIRNPTYASYLILRP
jgi:hypothetical protein